MLLVSHIRKAAVLGTGEKGLRIAALLANAGVETLLYELPSVDGDRNRAALRALEKLQTMRPPLLNTAARADWIIPVNYAEHLHSLRNCDLVFEAAMENDEKKFALYTRLAPYLGTTTIVIATTAVLSVERLASFLPEPVRTRCCGLYFGDSPGARRLVEMVACADTDRRVLDLLESFVVTNLGKNIVQVKDTPMRLATRIDWFARAVALRHAGDLELWPDTVEALAGSVLGWPKAFVYGYSDRIGPTRFCKRLQQAYELLADDPWRACFSVPEWFARLPEDMRFFRHSERQWQVWHPLSGAIRIRQRQVGDLVQSLLAIAAMDKRLAAFRSATHPEAQWVWHTLCDVLHYAVYWLERCTDNARELDLAMRWGCAWQSGPLEWWQAAGWKRMTAWLEQEIEQGHTLAAVPLPDWARHILRIHGAKGSYAPTAGRYRPRSGLPVYQRQCLPAPLVGEPQQNLGTMLLTAGAVRLWRLSEGVAVLSFGSGVHTIDGEVLMGLELALREAEHSRHALIIWQPEPPFSAGADLRQIVRFLRDGDFTGLEQVVAHFQRLACLLRSIFVPVVAAVQGQALGGACELLLYCDRVVAHKDAAIGLIEAGLGLLPAGGGCTELARRAAQQSLTGDPLPSLQRYFALLVDARVSRSAEQARDWGLLGMADVIVSHPDELLYVARLQAEALAGSAYRPPRAYPFAVAGSAGAKILRMALQQRRAEQPCSEHDQVVSKHIAATLCGGEVAPGTVMHKDRLLVLERAALLQLARTPSTRRRLEQRLAEGF